ncbi:MAG TPA: GNAT family N-acetyltransferase [Microbacterium sp.]|uniref:GNAT family N-acetyltransferase n=1 Tax=Microbacterium sp. TaxID=51671 RepID=UPI002B49AEBB|nr:GNAT family N-acetyltransferase [Microbacterium sp.]HKT56324.1 GNAT family N-acetyltransferase [Microbacterium sp.]
MPEIAVRAVRPGEWRQLRDFRLEALQDPDAGVAFLTRYEVAAAQPDELWQQRALDGSEDAGRRPRQRALVAVDGDSWVGGLTVIIRRIGDRGLSGHVVTARQAEVVGVYVAPRARGGGAVQALLDAAAAWTAGQNLAELQLFVHEANARARRAYEKAGFTLTGDSVVLSAGRELRMARTVA